MLFLPTLRTFWHFLETKININHRALAWTQALRATVVTTEYVVIEVGNSLTKGGDRAVFVDFYGDVKDKAKLEVVPASTELQDRGATLFAERPDKEWSLTDCISFVVMTERGLDDALSTDRDFEEAGFRPLLRYEPDERQ